MAEEKSYEVVDWEGTKLKRWKSDTLEGMQEIRRVARDRIANEWGAHTEIEVDDILEDKDFSEVDDGTWVRAWIWVPWEEVEIWDCTGCGRIHEGPETLVDTDNGQFCPECME
jgi:hypothetical protein